MESTKKSRLELQIAQFQQEREIYELRMVHGKTISEISSKTGLNTTRVFRILRKLEAENPEISEEMRKKGEDITPEDYKRLQEEVSRLTSELKKEKLRADFYEEMVAFGEEVYGIDLKKAGTR